MSEVTATTSADRRPHIVVLGAGFGGIAFCRDFPADRARITLVDRQNHHLFQPLLYQVATAGLSAVDIAQPIRMIFHRRNDLTVRLGEVRRIDLAGQRVVLADATLDYDHLVIGLGGRTSYFGHPEWEQHAPGLKSLDDALRLRRRVLLAFELAERETDEARRRELMTVVVVGGGPTGVELAGTIAELAKRVLADDFRHIDPSRAKVILIEAAPRILGTFTGEMAERGRRQLEGLGVEVRTGVMVKAIREGEVELPDEVIRARNVIWAAGVGAVGLTKELGVETDRAGRIVVQPDLTVPGHTNVFAIGDLAAAKRADGKPVPGVAPAAMQMGKYVARILAEELAVPPTRPVGQRAAFVYKDKGNLATIGRSRAVAEIGKLKFSGWPAWMAWLLVHLIFLLGFRNRVSVVTSWIYSYFTYRRGARIITGLSEERPVEL